MATATFAEELAATASTLVDAFSGFSSFSFALSSSGSFWYLSTLHLDRFGHLKRLSLFDKASGGIALSKLLEHSQICS
jgi:hypothetical protein